MLVDGNIFFTVNFGLRCLWLIEDDQCLQLDQLTPAPHQTQFELPFTVNYVAESFPAVYYTHRDYSA